MSPAASDNAFLHSIIGASVFSRNALTIPAVTSAISVPILIALIVQHF
jgi:hypothetical protein